MFEYRRCIDDAVLTALHRSPSQTQRDEYYIRQLTRAKGEAIEWIKFGFVQLLDKVAFGIGSIIEFGYQRVQKYFDRDAAAEERQEDKRKAIDLEQAVHDLKDTSTVESKVFADRLGVRDVCTSIMQGQPTA